MKELKLLLLLVRYIYLIPVKNDLKLNRSILFKSKMKRFIVLTFAIIFCYYYVAHIMKRVTMMTESILAPLLLIYSFLVTIKILLFITTPLYFAEEYCKLWNTLLNLSKYCKVLTMKNLPEIKFNLIIVCTLQLIYAGSSVGTLLCYKSGFELIVTLLVLSLKIIFCSTSLIKFLVLLSLFKNYFKQMNDLIKIIIIKDYPKKTRILLEIFKFYQEIQDSINLINKIFALHMIFEYCEWFIIITSHVHIIITNNYFGYLLLSVSSSLLLVIYGACTLFVPIFVAHNCASQVN